MEEIYHQLMWNAKLPTDKLDYWNKSNWGKTTKQAYYCVAEGGKKSSSDMLIGNERPFSWAGGQHRCMMGNWLFAEAEDEHGELLLPSPLERKQWRCSQKRWLISTTIVNDFQKGKKIRSFIICMPRGSLPDPPPHIYYIYVSQIFKKHQQQLINQ